MLRMIRAMKHGLSALTLLGLTGCADYVLIKKDQLEEVIDARLKHQNAEIRRELAQDQSQAREQIRQEIMRDLISEFTAPEKEFGQDGMNDSDGYDIRSVCWGMAQDEVIAAEGTNYLTCGQDGVSYLTKMVDLPCLLHYGFTDAQLTQAVFLFADPLYAGVLPEGARDQQKVFNDYLRLKQMLENKYGRYKVQEKQYSSVDEWQREIDALEEKIISYERRCKDLEVKMKRKEAEIKRRRNYKDQPYKTKKIIARFIENELTSYRNGIRRDEDWILKLRREQEDIRRRIKQEKELVRRGQVPSSIRCCWESDDHHEVILYYSNARHYPALRLAYNGLASPQLGHVPVDL